MAKFELIADDSSSIFLKARQRFSFNCCRFEWIIRFSLNSVWLSQVGLGGFSWGLKLEFRSIWIHSNKLSKMGGGHHVIPSLLMMERVKKEHCKKKEKNIKLYNSISVIAGWETKFPETFEFSSWETMYKSIFGEVVLAFMILPLQLRTMQVSHRGQYWKVFVSGQTDDGEKGWGKPTEIMYRAITSGTASPLNLIFVKRVFVAFPCPVFAGGDRKMARKVSKRDRKRKRKKVKMEERKQTIKQSNQTKQSNKTIPPIMFYAFSFVCHSAVESTRLRIYNVSLQRLWSTNGMQLHRYLGPEISINPNVSPQVILFLVCLWNDVDVSSSICKRESRGNCCKSMIVFIDRVLR